MKKFAGILFFIFIVLIAYSQEKNSMKSKRYYRFGPSFPTAGYFGNEKSDWDNTRRYGGVIEKGNIYIFNKLAINEKMCFGLNIDYVELKYLHFKTNNSLGNINGGMLSLSSKIGPSFSYTPSPKLIFDVYFKGYIPWLALYYEADGSAAADDVSMFGGYLGLGYSTGLNIRYSFFMFCIEFNKANMILYDADYDDEYLGDNSNANSKKTPMPSINVTFGFNF